ncbi:MAG: hypothetical protein OQJ99_07330 [Rhodospirillales bacterium]|nr:hypothetical protein [Rhodospirillales bacterium]MCW8861657.1 hypothetical protein [Rhodospirillales bacterium]MCW8952311.1 hypothetical protein [Rhodospirillales bacterium]MCW8970478.1 hypothetical protein [Rhodospirillales bacterium]MCW9003583.1 hypothetical protein [Rhodospirillales bacterium]
MTHFLVSDTNPDGFKLEDILTAVRKDMLDRALMIVDDHRSEAKHVMANNIKIMGLLTEAIALAEDSTDVLVKAFGPGVKGGPPRIGG